MMSRKTISTRWKEWAKVDPWWSYPTLTSMIGSFVALGVHLWVLDGPVRTWGLIVMIGLATFTETVLFFRSKKYPTLWWWFSFHTYIIGGVIGWELASYFFG